MHASQHAWPVRVAAVSEVAAGSAAWRFGGQLMITAIAKACFELVPDGDMRLVAPEPVCVQDDLGRELPGRPARRMAENAPQLPAVDVTMTGHAYPSAPGGAQGMARLTVGTHAGVLLDKVVYVYGERDARGALQPFERIALNYENALGGDGNADNPLGTGLGAAAARGPSVVDPRHPTRPACFAPIPSSFPVRLRLLGMTNLARRIVDLPPQFDWSYFNAAPVDQRIKALRGGEWVAIEGVLSDRPSLRSRLPLLRALGKIYGAGQAVPETMPLVIDTLRIDADARRCIVVWRGSFPLFDERALERLTLAVGLESEGEPVLWPEEEELADVPAAAAMSSRPPPMDDDEEVHTMQILAAPPPMPKQAAGVPFALAPVAEACAWPQREIPGAPWAKSSQAVRDALEQAKEQAKIDREHEEKAAREAEEKAARAEAERARAEAEERRRAEAEKFRAEQEAADREAARRTAAATAEQRGKTQQLRSSLYGGFKR